MITTRRARSRPRGSRGARRGRRTAAVPRHGVGVALAVLDQLRLIPGVGHGGDHVGGHGPAAYGYTALGWPPSASTLARADRTGALLEPCASEAAGSSARGPPTTSRPGASARASRASRGRGSAPRCRPRRCRSASSTRPGSATTRRSSPRRPRRCARCSPGGSGSRSARARPPTSTSPATRGPTRQTRNARLRECVDVIRALFAGEEVDHDGLVRVDRAKLWTLPAEPPPLLAPAVQRGDGALGGRVGGRPGHGQPAARAAASGCSTPSARAAARASRWCCRCTCRGRRPRRRRCGSPTTSGARTSSRRRCAGTSRRSSSSTRPRSTCGPRTCAGRCWSRPTSRATRRGSHELADARLRRDQPPPRRPGPAAPSSRRSASTCCRALMSAQGDQRPVVEERGRLLPRRRDVPGLRRRRLRRPRGPDRPHRLPGRDRASRCLWLMPFYPSRPARRRLRHHRLLRGRRAPRHARRLRRAGPHRRDRGIRVIADLVVNHTSIEHPWFQAGARPRLAVPRLLRLGRREAARRSPATSSSPTRRTRTGRGTRRRGSGTCTASTPTSPTSTSPTRRCATRSPRSSASGCSRGSPGSASTPCRS